MFIFCFMYRHCMFFFFKQKTAYEMRISDWSSDVCSSDLPGQREVRQGHRAGRGEHDAVPLQDRDDPPARCQGDQAGREDRARSAGGVVGHVAGGLFRAAAEQELLHLGFEEGAVLRSEEHTSELQSLMRISYAVFCLKQKINKIKTC